MRMGKRLWAGCLALCLLFAGCDGRAAAPLSRSGLYLDTAVTLTLYHTRDESILDECFRQIAEYEKILSRTAEDSDVWRINHAGGEPVTVSPETAALLETALEYAALSQGAVDVTIAPVSSLWDFKAQQPSLPGSGAIDRAVALVNWQGLHVDGNTVQLAEAGMMVDLGAVAKGYIADRLAETLRARGVDSALIDLGGNIYVLGAKNGKDWQVGVRAPEEDAALAATVRVRDKSVVTSGVYERGFWLEGTYYHHLLNPQTGWPVRNGLASVTILSDLSVQGDALSTACFVLGDEKGLALIEQLPGTEALFIREDGTQLRSSGFPS